MLWNDILEDDKKGLFTADPYSVSYETGITALDYANGYWGEKIDKDGNRVKYPVVGIPNGSLISVIGSTGRGKSTFAAQVGWNIVRKFANGMLIYIDCEKTFIPERFQKLTTKDMNRAILMKSNTSIEDVLNMVNKICEKKEANPKEYSYEINNGNSIFKKYEPTVFIIDSLPQFNSKEFNTDDLGGNADQMRASKDVTRFYTNIVDKAWKYNIIFIVINHIRPATNISPYAAPPPGLMMLNNQTESLPRGFVAQYYSNTYFRINAKKSANYTVDKDGFEGYCATIILAKSKTNTVGTSFPVAFNLQRGFDPIYSILEFASHCDLLRGSRNPNYYIEGAPEYKFDKKDFVMKMSVDEGFRTAVMTALKPAYEALLGSGTNTVDENTEILPYGDLSL